MTLNLNNFMQLEKYKVNIYSALKENSSIIEEYSLEEQNKIVDLIVEKMINLEKIKKQIKTEGVDNYKKFMMDTNEQEENIILDKYSIFMLLVENALLYLELNRPKTPCSGGCN